jgi:hypothetical protein
VDSQDPAALADDGHMGMPLTPIRLARPFGSVGRHKHLQRRHLGGDFSKNVPRFEVDRDDLYALLARCLLNLFQDGEFLSARHTMKPRTTRRQPYLEEDS